MRTWITEEGSVTEAEGGQYQIERRISARLPEPVYPLILIESVDIQ